MLRVGRCCGEDWFHGLFTLGYTRIGPKRIIRGRNTANRQTLATERDSAGARSPTRAGDGRDQPQVERVTRIEPAWPVRKAGRPFEVHRVDTLITIRFSS